MLETGFVSGETATNQPIFQLGRVQYAFSAPLALLAVSANVLTMCLYSYMTPAQLASGALPSSAPKLVSIDLDDPEKTMEGEVPLVPLPRTRGGPISDPSSQGPHKLFLDPSGRHTVLSTRNGDNFYWIAGWKKARILPKLKGLVIESIAWNQLYEPSKTILKSKATSSHRRGISGSQSPVAISSKEILIGTRSGDIYETTLTTNASEGDEGDFLDRLARRTAGSVGGGSDIDKYLHHVFRLPERQPVTGLDSEIFISGTPSRAVVIATTSTRIYEFVGEITKGRSGGDGGDGEFLYEKLFAPYRAEAIPNLKSELPGDLPYSELHTWTPRGKRNARALIWLTGPGIYHGLIKYGDQQVGDSVIDSANLLPYPVIAMDTNDGQEAETFAEIPLSIALTEFHFILLYRDRVMAISSLDDHVVFQESLPLQPHERAIGITVDTTNQTYWIYTDASIFEMVITEEDRNAWRIHLDRGNYEQALKQTKLQSQREIVLSAQGDHYFRDRRFIQAAQCYAQTFTRTFEEIVLQFIESDERDALRYYLVMRLERLRRSDVTQRMMLATWLIEIYLAKINELEDVAAAEEATQNVENYRIEMDLLIEELKQFLKTYKDNLDKHTTFGLITKHGRTEFMLHYAEIVKEHERIVRHWILESQWSKAIAVLNAQPSTELYYKFATTLIRSAPEETVDSWMKRENLSARRLIPAMTLYKANSSRPNVIIPYLQHIIRNGEADKTLHNFLLGLLAENDDSGLLSMITTSRPNPLTGQPYYDLDYALRVCTKHSKTEACVRIYAKMGNFESAVDLALKEGNVDLACVCADAVQNEANSLQIIGANSGASFSSVDRTTLRKKLWLRVARFVVEEKNDLSAAMAFLTRAPDLLSIEDILPFFPDFTVIDSFKDDICQALEKYSSKVESLKQEMDLSTQSAESIRSDTQRLTNRFVTVQADEKCSICQEAVTKRQFYVFACSHSFHADCLVAEVSEL